MYIYTEFTGRLAAGTGKYHVMLEHMVKTKEGEVPKTLEEYDICHDITKNRLEILAVVKGLRRMVLPSRITIYTSSEYVYSAFKHNRIEKWSMNEFKSGKRQIKHADLWKELAAIRKEHEIEIIKVEKTTYTAFQKRELKDIEKGKDETKEER